METQESIAIATWVYAVLTAGILGILIATAFVAKRQLKLMRRDSMRRFVKNLMEQWMTDKLVDARDALSKVLKQEVPKPSNKRTEGEFLKQKLNTLEEAGDPLHRHLLRVPHYFEVVSTLVESDPDALEEVLTLFKETIIHYYELYGPWIEEKRQLVHMEELYIEFEKLYKSARDARRK